MRTSRPILYALCGACLAAGCWLVVAWRFPPERTAARADGRGPDAYAGSSACRDCHARSYDLWAGSRHGQAMQAYSPEFSRSHLAPQGAPIAVGDAGARYRAEVGPGQGWIREVASGHETVYPISHVLGGKNVYYFLTPMPRGRLQTLPLAFDVTKQAWYDATSSDPHDHAAGKVDWTDRLHTFNTSCYGCHVSQISTRYDPDTDTYETHWTELGINCETCHGPGRDHVAVMRSAANGAVPKDLKIVSLRSFSTDQVNSLCGSCHAKMMPVSRTFSPGGRLFDHDDLVLLESGDFYPDGRDLGENYTMTSWRLSPCAKAGGLDCLHCHTSSGRYRFADPSTADQACLPCHRDQVASLEHHSRHRRTAKSPRCIDCHMPVTVFASMRRTDHSMRPPVPAATVRYGSPNACSICHADQGAEWAQQQVVRWKKASRQPEYLRQASLVDEARRGDWRNVARMLAYIQTKDRDEVVAGSIIRLLQGCGARSKWPALVNVLATDPSPLVRAAAAEALGSHLTDETLPALLKATEDDYRLVRVRAAASLASIDARRLEVVVGGRPLVTGLRQAVDGATRELLEGVTARADQPSSHFNLANILMAQHRTREALAAYRTAIKLEPGFVPAYVNMAFAFDALGASADAETCLNEALKREPNSALILTNLGLLFAETGQLSRAESSFRRAWAIDATSAVVAYNLSVLLADTQPLEALAFAERASSLSPDDQRYAYAYAFQLTRLEQTNRAVTILRRLIDRGPSTAAPYILLGQILEGAHRDAEAAAVYLNGANNPRLPEEQRRSFLESAGVYLRKR